jgi:S-adenosylmethionine decarboxylase
LHAAAKLIKSFPPLAAIRVSRVAGAAFSFREPARRTLGLRSLVDEEDGMRRDTLFQSRTGLGAPSTSRKKDSQVEINPTTIDQHDDRFVLRNGVRCAGTHLIIDLYDARRLDDIDHIETAMRHCVTASGATLLHIHLHHFEPNGGVSGVAVLAESHISIHSWPERRYAALDVFMCGEAEPEACIPVLREAFDPRRLAVSEILRGQGV